MRELLSLQRGHGGAGRLPSLSAVEIYSTLLILLLLETLSNSLHSHLVSSITGLSGGMLLISAPLWSLFLTRLAGLGLVSIYLMGIKKRSIRYLGIRIDTAPFDFFFGLRISLWFGGLVIIIALLWASIFEKDFFTILLGGGPGATHKTPEYTISYLMVAGLFAPLTEEILFRGIIYPFLRERFSCRWAIIFNATLFALAHGGSGGEVFVQFTGGLIFATLFEKRGSIISPLIVHSLGNIAIFAIQNQQFSVSS